MQRWKYDPLLRPSKGHNKLYLEYDNLRFEVALPFLLQRLLYYDKKYFFSSEPLLPSP